eukprot:NODE_1998_length_1331_cov_20.916537_g1814_i0.p1 GENE.NODE_1998_length_1331_cov_20.916537_g1814_i0~~NODE_1998_length_1331_cov_20.916537_g1814_i0.p1  ORF type:complete len:336 (+),score=48.17 NODE_1998_length_1331_cov_20.916537_g1814_i0:60-1010(+)
MPARKASSTSQSATSSVGGRERRDATEAKAKMEIIFCDAVPEDLLCGICGQAAIKAVVAEECGHLFCRSCILPSLERRRECPTDATPLTPEQVRKDVRTQRKVQSLSVFCSNKRSGCSWKGCLSDLERHGERCEWASVKCPFQPHGCDAVVTRRSLTEHVQSNATSHLFLLCTVSNRLQEENIALQQEISLLQRSDSRFIWIIPNFQTKRGPLYSRKFSARGAQWYLGIDFEGPDHHAGVYLFADGHDRRVCFKLILFNIDLSEDKVHTVNDWAPEFKGKGWGPLKFINRTNLEETGFLVNQCVRVGVELENDPFN